MNRTIKVFGPFEFDLTGYTLTRKGHRVRISGSQMELLALLLSRPGELVTREQIATLWTDPQAVDIRQGINTAVTRLRAALGDDPVTPIYIETVIGKGYRFIGQVDVLPDPVSSAPGQPVASRTNLREALPEAAFPAAGDGVVLDSPTIALTSVAPWREAIFRGNWLLFASLLLALISVAALVLRRPRQLLPPARGLWKEHQVTTNSIEFPVEAAALSPNGAVMAYVVANGLFLREMDTGRTRALNVPGLRVSQIAWLHGQTGLLVTGYPAGGNQPEIWIVPISGGPVLFHRAADGGTPAPNGQSIAFTTMDGREIHIVDIHGRDERVLARTAAEEPFSALFWSADGNRLGCQQRHRLQTGGVDIESNYQWTYVSREIQTGRETSSVQDLFFNAATETADGRLFFLRSSNSHNPDDHGIWTVRIDSATGAPVGVPTRLCCAEASVLLNTLTVTADGTQVAAVRELWQPNISVAGIKPPHLALEKIKRLTYDSASDFPHAWSSDNLAIYFESGRVNGKYHIFRQRLDQPTAEILTVGDTEQFFPTIAPGGQTLLYEQWEQLPQGKRKAIYRANEDGTSPRLVWTLNPLDEWRCPLRSGACVLRETAAHDFVFYRLDLVNGKKEELARCPNEPTLLGDWSLSPDGKTAALPNHAEHSPAIRLVHLDAPGPETAIPVRQAAQLRGIQWAADGLGFYAAVYAGKDHRLEWIALDGEIRPIRSTEGDSWIVPSPDGKKVAFVDSILSGNVALWY